MQCSNDEVDRVIHNSNMSLTYFYNKLETNEDLISLYLLEFKPNLV